MRLDWFFRTTQIHLCAGKHCRQCGSKSVPVDMFQENPHRIHPSRRWNVATMCNEVADQMNVATAPADQANSNLKRGMFSFWHSVELVALSCCRGWAHPPSTKGGLEGGFNEKFNGRLPTRLECVIQISNIHSSRNIISSRMQSLGRDLFSADPIMRQSVLSHLSQCRHIMYALQRKGWTMTMCVNTVP